VKIGRLVENIVGFGEEIERRSGANIGAGAGANDAGVGNALGARSIAGGAQLGALIVTDRQYEICENYKE